MIRKRTSLIGIYKRMYVLYSALLVVGNTIRFSPPYYLLLGISILSVFLSGKYVEICLIKEYVFMAMFVLYGMIIAVAGGGSFGAAFTLITGLVVCSAVQKLKFDKTDILILVIAMLVSMAYWLYRSPTYYNEFFYNHWKGDSTYTNANGVGHYLCYECAFMFMILSRSPKKSTKSFKWLLAAVCLWGIYNVRARMAFATLLVFLLSDSVINALPKFRSTFVKAFLAGSIIMEIVFPFIYLWLYRSKIGMAVQMFGLTTKGLYTGRQDIWSNAFQAMNTVPKILFGVGSKKDFWESHVLNLHNNAMNLLVVVGVVGLAAYFLYLIFYIIKKFDFKRASKTQWQCLLFFICILLEGITDITIFYSNFLAYYFIPLGIALSPNYYGEEKTEKGCKDCDGYVPYGKFPEKY